MNTNIVGKSVVLNLANVGEVKYRISRVDTHGNVLGVQHGIRWPKETFIGHIEEVKVVEG